MMTYLTHVSGHTENAPMRRKRRRRLRNQYEKPLELPSTLVTNRDNEYEEEDRRYDDPNYLPMPSTLPAKRKRKRSVESDRFGTDEEEGLDLPRMF
jgi:hypothetical protein